jgi:hypothetical protein
LHNEDRKREFGGVALAESEQGALKMEVSNPVVEEQVKTGDLEKAVGGVDGPPTAIKNIVIMSANICCG